MDDKSFAELKLAMDIVPEQSTWDTPKFSHQIALHGAADAARGIVGKLDAAIAKIDNDTDLTSKGKANSRTKAASAALAELEKSDGLAKARRRRAASVPKLGRKIWHRQNYSSSRRHSHRDGARSGS